MNSRVFNIAFLVSACLSITCVLSQAPQKVGYQATIRNANNELLVNTNVSMQINILQGSSSGISVYMEVHSPTTNTNGLISIEIGNGSVIFGNFSEIDWASGPYFK